MKGLRHHKAMRLRHRIVRQFYLNTDVYHVNIECSTNDVRTRHDSASRTCTVLQARCKCSGNEGGFSCDPQYQEAGQALARYSVLKRGVDEQVSFALLSLCEC